MGIAGMVRWRRGLLPLPDTLRGRVEALSARFGLSVLDRVRLSPTVLQPLVVGTVKPLVLLPVSLATGMRPVRANWSLTALTMSSGVTGASSVTRPLGYPVGRPAAIG